MKPGNIKIGTWYKSGNILMLPYKENGEDLYGDRKVLMITYQNIDHWEPKEVEIRIYEWTCNERMQHKGDQNSPTYLRNFLYADEAEWCIEEKSENGDFRKANSKDKRILVEAMFHHIIDEDLLGYL